MESEINLVELVQEMEKRFPKELTICVQAVQIKKLENLLGTETEDLLLKETEDGENA